MIKLILGISVLFSFGISGTATAGEDSGVYLYGAVGQSQQSSVNQDAYKLSVGYQVNPKWSVEIGHADLGKNPLSKSSATHLSAVRSWIVPNEVGNNPFSILVRFGLAQVKTSSTSALVPDLTKKGLTFGLGAKYDFDQNWSIQVDADSFDSGQNASGRIPVYSVGLSYKY
jgi:long-subunit fatty acid transport protein